MSAKLWTKEEKRERQRIRQIQWRKENPEKVRAQAEKKAQRAKTQRAKGKVDVPDKLLENLVADLDEYQLLYLINHRREKRSVLAKKLGIRKLQLNHMLDIQWRLEQC